MANDWYTLDELALQLGRDRREIEKLVQRGRIPGHRVAGEWRFHTIEITHWLEEEIRQFSREQLEQVELSYADNFRTSSSLSPVAMRKPTSQSSLGSDD